MKLKSPTVWWMDKGKFEIINSLRQRFSFYLFSFNTHTQTQTHTQMTKIELPKTLCAVWVERDKRESWKKMLKRNELRQFQFHCYYFCCYFFVSICCCVIVSYQFAKIHKRIRFNCVPKHPNIVLFIIVVNTFSVYPFNVVQNISFFYCFHPMYTTYI